MGHEAAILDQDFLQPLAETAIVEMALRLGDRRIGALMTPRTQIEFLDLDDPEEETRRQIRESAYSRFPVLQGGTHQLAGIVQVKDLLVASMESAPFDLRPALHPAPSCRSWRRRSATVSCRARKRRRDRKSVV